MYLQLNIYYGDILQSVIKYYYRMVKICILTVFKSILGTVYGEWVNIIFKRKHLL